MCAGFIACVERSGRVCRGKHKYKTEAIGLPVKRGKYGGTYAHKDIAFEFASAISPVFKLYLIKEFQRLKEAENDVRKMEWDAKRFLSRNNYHSLF